MTNTINLLALFGAALLLDVMPAFVPPTWMVMSRVGSSRPEANPVIFAGVAACAATVDQLVLARLSYLLARNRWICEADRQNIDAIRTWLEDRRDMTVGLILTYAFSPFPFNYTFVAYGLTGMRLWLIGLSFFVGRWVSYLTWTHTAQIDAHYPDEETEVDGAYMGAYFVMSQVMFLALACGLAKLDWRHLLQAEHLRWWQREPITSPAEDTRTKVER